MEHPLAFPAAASLPFPHRSCVVAPYSMGGLSSTLWFARSASQAGIPLLCADVPISPWGWGKIQAATQEPESSHPWGWVWAPGPLFWDGDLVSRPTIGSILSRGEGGFLWLDWRVPKDWPTLMLEAAEAVSSGPVALIIHWDAIRTRLGFGSYQAFLSLVMAVLAQRESRLLLLASDGIHLPSEILDLGALLVVGGEPAGLGEPRRSDVDSASPEPSAENPASSEFSRLSAFRESISDPWRMGTLQEHPLISRRPALEGSKFRILNPPQHESERSIFNLELPSAPHRNPFFL